MTYGNGGMRNLVNSQQAYTGLVQKYIGSAYDNVLNVAGLSEAIEALKHLIDNNVLQELHAVVPELQKLFDKLTDFKNQYYGTLDKEPTERPNGDPSKDGDMYYDNVRGGMFVLTNGSWIPMNNHGTQLEVQDVAAGDFAADGSLTMTLKHPFLPGTNNALVFVNATYQYPQSSAMPHGAYREVDNDKLFFAPGVLEEDDVITVLVGNIASTTDHVFSVNVENKQVTQDGTGQEIVIPGGMRYVQNMHNLEVYLNGKRQMVGIDYVESATDRVTFQKILHQGDMLSFKSGNILSSNYSTREGGKGELFVLNVMGEFHLRENTLDKNGIVVLLGYNRLNDNGGGIFIYDPVVDRSTANGGTIIDATELLQDQGKGTGIGCWVRQYAEQLYPQWFGEPTAFIGLLNKLGVGRPGDYIDLHGYWSIDDGGQGRFYWNDTLPKNRHDGGIVVDPRKVFPGTWDSATATDWFTGDQLGQGCWQRDLQKNFPASIQWFGAVGDGGTDNAPVFIGLRIAIANNGLEYLQIPEGDFQLQTDPSFVITNMGTQFTLEGFGEGSELTIAPGNASFKMELLNVHDMTFRNFKISDQRSTGSNSLFDLQDAANITFENMFFKDIPGIAIELSGTLPEPGHNFKLQDCLFDMCGSAGNSVVKVSPQTHSQNMRINGNTFGNCGAVNSFIIEGGMGYSGVDISHNSFVDTLGSCIHVAAYEDAAVKNNTCLNFAGTGIQITCGSHMDFGAPKLKECIVSNNLLSDTSGTDYGITVDGNAATNGPVHVENNTVIGCGGIRLIPQGALDNLLVSENKIQEVPSTLFALLIDSINGASPQNPHVYANLFENINTVRTAAFMLVRDSADAVIRENYFRRSSVEDIQLQNAARAQILDNTFFEPNQASGTDPCITINDSTATVYSIRDNRIVAGRIGNAVGLVSATDTTPLLKLSNNNTGDSSVPVIVGPVNTNTNAQDPVLQLGPNRHFYGNAAPTTGAYIVGDVVWNTQPASGGKVGWVCVTAGTPGTWKDFGSIS